MTRIALRTCATLLGLSGACHSEAPTGPHQGTLNDGGAQADDHGRDASTDAGPVAEPDGSMEDACAFVGCASPPLCSVGCQEPCGCCDCADGEREQRDGVDLRCSNGCFEPVSDDPAASCDALPDELADALEVAVTAYVPPSACMLRVDHEAYLTVSDEQGFRQAFSCTPEDTSPAIDFAQVRLEILPAGYAAPDNDVGREPRWARSKNGVLTIGWVEPAWCAGAAPSTAVMLALVPVGAPAMVVSHGCTEGSCNWGDAGPPP